MKKSNVSTFIRTLIIELTLYGVLLVLYFLLVLRYLGGFLTNLFYNQTWTYAFLGLGLIVAQAVVLEKFTSYLLQWLRLDRLG